MALYHEEPDSSTLVKYFSRKYFYLLSCWLRDVHYSRDEAGAVFVASNKLTWNWRIFIKQKLDKYNKLLSSKLIETNPISALTCENQLVSIRNVYYISFTGKSTIAYKI